MGSDKMADFDYNLRQQSIDFQVDLINNQSSVLIISPNHDQFTKKLKDKECTVEIAQINPDEKSTRTFDFKNIENKKFQIILLDNTIDYVPNPVKLIKEINRHKLVKSYSEIIDTKDVVLDNESPLTAAKKSKESSMWKAIESLKENKSDISLSAGNTGALLVISRLLLKTIEGINKPALAALWPNQNSMNVVLDLGANIECNEKNLLDFSVLKMGDKKIQFTF